MKKIYLGLGIIILLVAVGVIFTSNQSEAINLSDQYGVDKVVIYKSPTCGCCDLYSAYMKKFGVEVVVENVEDMEAVKDEHDIPSSLYSCHTTVIGDKVVEGHIPVEAIASMLESDSVSNIGMPGMPAGSPGMPGTKTAPFTIYSFDNGNVNEFINI